MLKKTITFKDLDGNDVTEDFYFNLTKAEVAEAELSFKGGLSIYLNEIIAAEDGGAIIKAFKEIIKLAVGRRSEDGRRFEKSEEITNDFLQTDAYSQMFMELVTNATLAAEFVQGIVPADMADEMKKTIAAEATPAWITEDRDPTEKEVQNMTPEQLRDAFARKQAKQVATINTAIEAQSGG